METTATTNRNGADTMTTTTKTTTTIRTHRLPSGRKLAWTNDHATGRHTFSGGHYGEVTTSWPALAVPVDVRALAWMPGRWDAYCENNAAHATEVEA